MPDALLIYKNRVNIVPVDLGFDVSGDTITSEIRTESGVLIATWNVVFDSDGSDGKLILSLDDSDLGSVEYTTGVMDLKRVSGGNPFAVFEKPIEVEFVDSVTV